MYHMSTQGVDERMINVHYYYYQIGVDYEYEYCLCHLTFSGYYFSKKSSAYMLLVMSSQGGFAKLSIVFYFELELVLVLIKNLRCYFPLGFQVQCSRTCSKHLCCGLTEIQLALYHYRYRQGISIGLGIHKVYSDRGGLLREFSHGNSS